MPYYTKDPKKDHNFDNHPYPYVYAVLQAPDTNQAVQDLVASMLASLESVPLLALGSFFGVLDKCLGRVRSSSYQGSQYQGY